MMKDMQQRLEAVERVTAMEALFDTLRKAAEEGAPLARAELEALTRYYEGGDWLRDYELDERGLLPPELKRGVLSQDALFDFLGAVK